VEQTRPFKRPLFPNLRQSTPRTYQRDTSRSGNGLRHREFGGIPTTARIYALLRRGLRRIPLVYGFALELRSLLHRMGIRYKRRYEVYGLDLGQLHRITPDGHLALNIRTRACTRDIENFLERHPWATMVDLEMYRDAWLAGAVWAESNSYSYSEGQAGRAY
jgi:hypothetical protein